MPGFQQWNGAEALIVSASGCGAHVRTTLTCWRTTALMPAKAKSWSHCCATRCRSCCRNRQKDCGSDRVRRVSRCTPCTLQHALKLNGATERLLQSFGYQLSTVGGVICVAALPRDLFDPAASDLKQLRQRKLHALKADHPDLIVSANIRMPDASRRGGRDPGEHWLNVVAEDLQS